MVNKLNRLYHATMQRFASQKACLQQTASCRLTYGTYRHPVSDLSCLLIIHPNCLLTSRQNIAGIWSYYLACSNAKPGDSGNHYHYSLISKDVSLDINLLKHLIDVGQPATFQRCGIVNQQLSRRPKCGKFNYNYFYTSY
jgi:hypothetical protein